MDVYQIKYFLAIAEMGGFTKAAEHLFVSQPSLSAGIKKLEQELGVTLFERGGRRAILTPAGKHFLEKAKTILDEYQSAMRELKGFQTKETLKIGALRTIRITELSGLIGGFRAKYPNMSIELCDGNIEELRRWLQEGEIDLAVSVLGSCVDSKTSLPLFEQRRLLAVAKTHPLAQRETVSLAELDGLPYIERINCEMWGESQNLFESQGINLHTVYKADHEEWVISLVIAGLGVAIMPEWQGIPEIAYIPITNLNLVRTVGLIWRMRQESELVSVFRNFATTYNWYKGSALKSSSLPQRVIVVMK
ncbi:LysR family transcriptional regulator [Nostoc sp. CCY 9925]|uniref:LysR family transcriptional regulator n=1 Tax=Nostoc sp. CCY 9925 TaxID=3103865 RepID=UPI0039C5D176